MKTTSDYLPERKVNRACPSCNDWNMEKGGCDWCNYQEYKLENENEEAKRNYNSVLPLSFD